MGPVIAQYTDVSVFWYQLFFFEEVFYPCALALIKISILLFYLRVFPNRTIRTLVYVLIFLNIGYAAAFSIALIFQCNPVRGAWEAWDGQHPATCLDTNTMGFAAAGANIVLDVATLTLPLHDVTKLRMGLRKKIQVLAMFAVGFLYVFCPSTTHCGSTTMSDALTK